MTVVKPRSNVRLYLFKRMLSDGSFVYDVSIRTDDSISCTDERAARALISAIAREIAHASNDTCDMAEVGFT